jgi:adenylate cyclase
MPPPQPALLSTAELKGWLVGESLAIADAKSFIEQFADRMLAAGVPIDRMTTAIETMHADYSGIGRFWTRGEGVVERYWPYDSSDGADAVYKRSPFYECHTTKKWCRFKVAETPDERFGVVPDLKAGGFTDYVCVPMFFSNGDENGLSFATRAPGGFSEQHMAMLRDIVPALTTHMELQATRRRMDFLLRFYVGQEPAQQIFSGVVRRGQVREIRSAILVADMRHYTELSHDMPPDEVANLLNRFFDCLVPHIEAEGGEVLKFMGDGLLAIFRDRSDDAGSAAQAALTASEKALAAVRELDAKKELPVPLHAGIALHHGRAAYGNVGSGTRLDFTVVGADVNIASRLATLNRPLGEPLLMSDAFADQLWTGTESIGAHNLAGVPHPVKVYRPTRQS